MQTSKRADRYPVLGGALLLCCYHVYGWDGRIEFGGMQSRGNTTVNQLKLLSELRHSVGDFSVELNADGLRETSGTTGQTSAERASLRGNLISKSAWTRGQYWFVAPIWRHDRFGYVVQVREVFAGVGWQWGEVPLAGQPEPWTLRFEAGPGYRYSRLSDGQAWTGVGALLRARGSVPLTETLGLEGELALEAGERVRELLGKLILAQKISDHLALRIGWYQVRTQPVAPDKRPTDSNLSLSLAYAF